MDSRALVPMDYRARCVKLVFGVLVLHVRMVAHALIYQMDSRAFALRECLEHCVKQTSTNVQVSPVKMEARAETL